MCGRLRYELVVVAGLWGGKGATCGVVRLLVRQSIVGQAVVIEVGVTVQRITKYHSSAEALCWSLARD
jgi:hypothetical protein